MHEWTQDEIDDDQHDDAPDVCHHGFGFDETCEYCEDEIAENEADWREQSRIVSKLLR